MKTDETETSKESEHVSHKKEKTSLRLRLNRVFSSGALRSPKSPSSTSDSSGSSPKHSNSPTVKTRHSWQVNSPNNKYNRSARSSESEISSLASKSPINESTLGSPATTPTSAKSCCTPVWYTATGNN